MDKQNPILTKIKINTNSKFFTDVFMPVCRKVEYPQKDITIAFLNKERSIKLNKEVKEKIKFVFDYQDDNNDIIGIDVFYIGEL